MPSPHVVKHVIKLRKQIGLLEATSITVGSIIGSGQCIFQNQEQEHKNSKFYSTEFVGIFISPKGVIDNAGSVGLSLLLWILCGLQAGLGAICYAELGTSLPGSGGDYHYLNKAFGNLPAFTFLWVSNIILLYVHINYVCINVCLNYFDGIYLPVCPDRPAMRSCP